MISKSESLIKGISSQTVVTIVMGVLSLVSFSLFSRILDKEIFGYFAALTAVLTIFQAFSDAGLGSAVIQKQDCSDSYYSTAFSLGLIVSSVLAILLFLLAPCLSELVADETICNPLRILSLLLITSSIESIGRAMMMKRLQFLKYGYFQIVSYLISYGLGIFLAIRGAGLYALVISALMNSFLLCVFLFTIGTSIPFLTISKQDGYKIFNYGSWLTASVLVNQVTHQVDKLTLGKWLTVASLGAYSRPSTFINQITERINNIFDTVLFPILSSIQNNKDSIKGSFIRAISILNSFSSVLAFMLIVNSSLLVRIFFGEEWLELVPIFQAVGVGVIFAVDQRLADCYFRSLALVKLNFYIRCLCLILMFLALFIGTKYDVLGTAIAVVASNIIATIIKTVVLCKKIQVSIIHVLRCFLLSFKASLPLIGVWGCFFIFSDEMSILPTILLCAFSVIIVVCEFVFFPKMVSAEYCELAKPYLSKMPNFFSVKK